MLIAADGTLPFSMSKLITIEQFPSLFLNDTPLLDLRSPAEFRKGSFSGATNLPLLDDEERQAVGLCYRQHGQQAAIALGHKLISGEVRESRLKGWSDYFLSHLEAVLFCWRGGLRSEIVQQWLADAGIVVPRVDGGYKHLRRYLLDSLQRIIQDRNFLIVAGKTGCGKTHLINQLPSSIDLEALANHRGSAFGPRIGNQPSQIDFENRLAVKLLKLEGSKSQRLFIEDESHAIGSLSIPAAFFRKMRTSPIAVIEQPLESRAEVILNDYICSNYQELLLNNPSRADDCFTEYLLSSLKKIQRRLGGDAYKRAYQLMASALDQGQQSMTAHREWIKYLLETYYDPMYDYQLNKRLQLVVFRGNAEEFRNWTKPILQEA